MGFFALSEFYGGSCIVLVVIWRELQGVLPRDTSKTWRLCPPSFLQQLLASFASSGHEPHQEDCCGRQS